MTDNRRPFVGGNWKMNGSQELIHHFAQVFADNAPLTDAVDVLVAPPSIYLTAAKEQLSKAQVLVSSQNVHQALKGAFTGELSASMLLEAGIQWTLIGHSERRQYFSESDSIVSEKLKTAIDSGLHVVLCIGETLEQRESGQTISVIQTQLSSVLLQEGLDFSRIVIAYEPVWAIGTGKVASPQEAEKVHAGIRAWLSDNLGVQVASSVRIIYGGSVNAANSATLIACENIDGFLVGGASLKPSDFLTIIKSCT